jgi:hypothetical protein
MLRWKNESKGEKRKKGLSKDKVIVKRQCSEPKGRRAEGS